MKKNLFIALLMAVLAIPASAQIKWGVEGGYNMNYLKGGGMTEDTQSGFFIGPKAQLTIPLAGLMVDGALQYSQLGRQNTDAQSYLIVPINLKYGIGVGSMASVYVSTGPQYNFCISDGQLDMKTHTLNWNVGAGVHFLTHFQAGITYSIPLGDSTDAPSVAGLVTNGKENVWQVRVAYMF